MHVQSCPTLCDPMDCSPQGSSVRGILQARTLELVVMHSSRGSSRPRDQIQVSYISNPGILHCRKLFSHVQLFATPWTIQSMEFSRPEHWSGQPFPSPGIFPTQGLSPGLPHCRQILYQLSYKGSSRIQEWVAYPSPKDLPDPGLELGSSALQADSLPTELFRKPEPPGKTLYIVYVGANNLPFNFQH